MRRIFRNQRGFTMIEMIMVIVIVALLAVVAIPIYTDLVAKAKQSNEDAVVGGVRAGLSTYFIKQLRDTGTGSYPAALDALAINTPCSGTAACFVTILGQGGVTSSWTKVTGGTYRSPVNATNVWTYDSAAGTFEKTTT